MIFLQEAIAFAKLLEVRFQEQHDHRREELDTLVTLLVSIPGDDVLFMNVPYLMDDCEISISYGYRPKMFCELFR
jgi:hypothetical protein